MPPVFDRLPSDDNVMMGVPHTPRGVFQTAQADRLVARPGVPESDRPWQAANPLVVQRFMPRQARSASGHPMLSTALTQWRWLKVVAWVDKNNELVIPVTDDDDLPLLDPSTPPTMIVRQTPSNTAGGFGQVVTNPNGLNHADKYTTHSPPGIYHANMDGIYVLVRLRRNKSPRPHWDLVIRSYEVGSRSELGSVVYIDLLGVGAGVPRNAPFTRGTASTHGYHHVALPWTQQGFYAAPDSDANNDIALFYGAVYVTASGSADVYFRFPNGGSGDTAFLDASTYLPAVRVHGATRGSDVTGSPPWSPTTTGLGLSGVSPLNPVYSAFGPQAVGFRSELVQPASEYLLRVFNIATVGGSQRTYFVSGWGVRA